MSVLAEQKRGTTAFFDNYTVRVDLTLHDFATLDVKFTGPLGITNTSIDLFQRGVAMNASDVVLPDAPTLGSGQIDAPVDVVVRMNSFAEDQFTSLVVNDCEVFKLYPLEGETPVAYQHRVERARLLAVAVAERMALIRR